VTAKHKSPDAPEADEQILERDLRWKIAERAARSSALTRATQLKDILLFIVRQAILKPEEPIHEFEIAYRVLGRRSDFNPLDDNIVRVQVAHLRKKLDLYFSTEGKNEEVIITVALGNYKPVFSNRSKPPALAPAADLEAMRKKSPADTATVPVLNPPEAAPAEMKPPVADRRWMPTALIATAVIALALAGCCTTLWIQSRERQHELEAMQQTLTPWRYQPAVAGLWSSFFDSGHDTDVVIGDDSLLLIEQITKQYPSFNSYLSRSYLSDPKLQSLGPDKRFVLNLVASKGLGSTSEFKLAQRVMALDPLHKRVHLYSSRQYMPTLLKQDNVILIGGRASNPWEGLFRDKLNFNEDMKFKDLGVSSVTNHVPQAGEEAVNTSTDQIGYCVIAYLPDPSLNTFVLLMEGTNSEATEAAGDFLLSEAQLSGFLKKMHATTFPPFEVLLKISQVKGTPLTATIAAYRTYPSQH